MTNPCAIHGHEFRLIERHEHRQEGADGKYRYVTSYEFYCVKCLKIQIEKVPL